MRESKLEKGIVVKIAGKTMKARSGPLRGIASILVFVNTDIWPIKEKITNAARRPHNTVNKEITYEL